MYCFDRRRPYPLVDGQTSTQTGGRNYGEVMPSGVDVSRIRGARDLVAKLVIHDPVYLPIFERLEAELRAAETVDPIEKARAIATMHRATFVEARL